MILTIWVPGKPVPKGRPRLTRGGHAYTPAHTHQWESIVASAGRDVMDGRPPLSGPVLLAALFYGARANADIDNLLKSVLDGLNGVVYEDDSQVQMLAAWRMKGEPHGVKVTVQAEG